MLSKSTEQKAFATAAAEQLYSLEEIEKAKASSLPQGFERDKHEMVGERLSDEAWHIEEQNELDPRPSGLWPESS